MMPAFDAGSFPDELSTRCDGTGNPSVGAGIAAIFRPNSWLVLEGDTRGSAVAPLGCSDLGFPPTEVAPNVYESHGRFSYSKSTPGSPRIRSAFHVGVETPSAFPLVRATVGTGMFWAASPIPYASAAIAASSRRDGARFFMELERNIARVRAVETFRRNSENPYAELPPRVASVIVHPQWTMLHVGFEFPLVDGAP